MRPTCSAPWSQLHLSKAKPRKKVSTVLQDMGAGAGARRGLRILSVALCQSKDRALRVAGTRELDTSPPLQTETGCAGEGFTASRAMMERVSL